MNAMARSLRRALAALTASVLALTLSFGVSISGARAQAAPARAVFMLGDSVMLGSKAAAEKQFADWQLTFDAAVNRSTLAGAQIAAARRGEMRDFVVVQLGHNDGGSPSLYTQRVDAVMKALAGVPHVVWLTIHEVRPYYKTDNEILRQAATRYPNMRIADWNAVANATPNGMASDGLHLNATGAAAMAKLIDDTIEPLYSGGGGTPAPAPAPPTDPNAVCRAATSPKGTPSPASGRGYWLLDSKGKVHGYGAENLGDLTTARVSTPPVSLQSTPSGGGYWIVDQQGRVYAFGDAVKHGDMAGTPLNGPVRRLEPTPSGSGYWLLGSDGGVFTFNVPFHGSAGARPPSAAVISIASTASGGGYMLVTARGAVLPFGDAKTLGGTETMRLAAPIISLALGAGGSGYWLYAQDGGVFSFGAPFHGSVPGLGLCAVPRTVALRATSTGLGYWIVTETGKVYPFGDARDLGGSPPLGAGVKVIDMAVRR
jgi:lysophospholipase L1-like esterase